MDRDASFWDKVAHKYSTKPVPDEAVYQEKLAITREYLRPDMEVLEIGCGTGSTAIEHAPYVRHILATDISARMIEIAQRKAAARGVDNVTFERHEIGGLSLADESFDAVLALSVLHLVESKEKAIEAMHAVLKPGGIFVTSTPCIGDAMRWFKLVVPIGRLLGLMPTVKVFTRQELEDALTGAGFAVDRAWQPGIGKAVFIVAKKGRTAASGSTSIP